MNRFLVIIIAFVIFSCSEKPKPKQDKLSSIEVGVTNTSIVILGTAQDAGSPQIGCKKECCIELFEDAAIDRRVISLGLIDTDNQKTYMFDATPDISKQMKMLTTFETKNDKELVDGIFLTHAHIGHYT